MWDVIVVGAGMAGITAAQHLSQAGYGVLVLDKSRGLGGRVATRRVGDVVLDHGCRYVQSASELAWIPALLEQGILQPWQPAAFTLGADNRLGHQSLDCPHYVAPQGMTAIAKALAQGLTIQRQCQVSQVFPTDHGWAVTATTGDGTVQTWDSKALILAIPAAQIPPLLKESVQSNPALAALVAAAAAVAFDPVITVMAGYAPEREIAPRHQSPTSTGWMIEGKNHPTLRWMALDSSKRPNPPYPTLVLHSSATFAAEYFEAAELSSVGQHLLTEAADVLGAGTTNPDWMQVHRWRYGFVTKPHPAKVLATETVPTLAGCGDWCGGSDVDAAMISGAEAAVYITSAFKPS